jgi:hypothetical protein
MSLKKFTLHLDAAIVIALLFLLTLGLNLYQYREYKALKDENYRLQLQGLEDSLNLDSMRSHIERLNGRIERLEAAQSATELSGTIQPGSIQSGTE